MPFFYGSIKGECSDEKRRPRERDKKVDVAKKRDNKGEEEGVKDVKERVNRVKWEQEKGTKNAQKVTKSCHILAKNDTIQK